jgi:alpha-tubulin suppressor-like RCC1 family protein
VAGGLDHTIALRTDATVFAWGDNSQGQLGDGTTTNRRLPVVVPGVTNSLVDLAPGGFHSVTLAVLS